MSQQVFARFAFISHQRRIRHQPQHCLMFARNPIPCTGNQVEVATVDVAEDVLERRVLRWIGSDSHCLK